MKNLTQKQKRLIIAKALMQDEEILAGGVNEQKEQYYMKKYDMTIEEIINIELCIHAIAFGEKVEML